MSEQEGPDLEAGMAAAALAEGAPVAGSWRGEKLLLLKRGGKICALSATCTHLGAPLGEGLVVDGEIHCPWHHARFSLDTGEAVGAPAFTPLTRYATTEREGRVFVSGPLPAVAPGVPAGPPRVVVLGAGAAGYACAQWLLRHGFGGSLHVVSDEADPPYDRTFCSKQYLIGMKSREETLQSAFDPGHVLEAPVLRANCTADAIDVASKELVLDGGERLGFDVLVLAMGAQPKRAQWPGAQLPNVHVLRTLRDADALIRASMGAKRVAVIGASFIGLEAAASLRQRNLAVDVVTPEDVPLKDLLGEDVGAMIRRVHEEKGVRFHLGREVRGFDGERLTLDDGASIEADFVVVGLGVTPRTDLAAAAGLECAAADEGGGVVVNQRLETSFPGIFAVGDIARYPDVHTGKTIRVEHWVHAQRQGQHVARAILGQRAAYRDLPFFWSAHFDTGLRYMGHVTEIRQTRTEGSVEGRDFVRTYHGAGDEKAFVTCNRDTEALRQEAAWEHAVQDQAGSARAEG